MQNNDKRQQEKNKEPPLLQRGMDEISYTGQTQCKCKECEPSNTGWCSGCENSVHSIQNSSGDHIAKCMSSIRGMNAVACPATALQLATHTHHTCFNQVITLFHIKSYKNPDPFFNKGHCSFVNIIENFSSGHFVRIIMRICVVSNSQAKGDFVLARLSAIGWIQRTD